MKSFYVLLILCLSLTTAFSQDNPDRIETLTLYRANTDHWKLIYTYDKDGNMSNIVTDLWENGQWVTWYNEVLTYDANGNLLNLLAEIWNNDQWEDDYQYTYTYDSDGNLLSNLYGYWDDGLWSEFYICPSLDYEHSANFFKNRGCGCYFRSKFWLLKGDKHSRI